MNHFLFHLPMLLAMGMAGALHCAGMCGGLAVLAGGARRPLRFLLYLTGKAAAYAFLGSLAGAFGDRVLKGAPLGWGSRLLAVTAAALLLAAGVESLGLLRLNKAWLVWPSRVMAQLAAGGRAGVLLLGAANGLLPCPMVYAFLAVAAMVASPLWSAAVMLVLAATSALPLAGCSLLAGRFIRFRTVSAVLMLAMAAITLYRGLSPAGALRHHLH